jgi:hypothetical protein
MLRLPGAGGALHQQRAWSTEHAARRGTLVPRCCGDWSSGSPATATVWAAAAKRKLVWHGTRTGQTTQLARWGTLGYIAPREYNTTRPGFKTASTAACAAVSNQRSRLQGGRSHHFPRSVMTAHAFPCSSTSLSTFVVKEIALMIPSPNFSFNTALYAYP